MPESSCAHTYKRNTSYPLAMESPMDIDKVSLKSINMEGTERTMSVESLNTLLSNLPEIIIPPTLHNPLPLQCLAANALPEGVKAEIDKVIAQYSACPVSSVCHENHCTITASEATDSVAEEGKSNMGDKDVDTLTAALQKALQIEEFVDPKNTSQSVPEVPVFRITIQRDNEGEIYGGFGLKLCGGVRCNNCSSLHAIVTDISPSLDDNEEISEGVCVAEWNGQFLDGCTYEEVQRLVSSTDPRILEIEISVKKCGENILISHGAFNWLPSFATVRFNKRRNAAFEHKRDSDCKSTMSEESSESATIPPSPSRHALGRSQELLYLPLSDLPPTPHQRSCFPSPTETSKPLTVAVPNAEGTTLAMLTSLDTKLKNPLNSILNSVQPKGMVQLCLDYNKDFEELNMSLVQVKGQSNKEFSDPSDVFINTYLVPDIREQGVRSIMSLQARKDSTEYHNNSYMLASDEISSLALRVILWDARKAKNIMFRGEVLLSLSDQQIVNLTSEPTWYTLCPEDPNLPKLPPPVHFKHRQSNVDSIIHKLKQKAHSLTTIKPILKPSSSLSSEFKASSMLSLPGSVEARSMTLTRKKQRKETRKTHSGSFPAQVVEPVLSSEITLKSCLKEPYRQQKLSSILNVLKESKEDLSEEALCEQYNRFQSVKTNSEYKSTDGKFSGPFTTVDRRLRKKAAAAPEAQRLSFPGRIQENSVPSQHFLEELEKMMGKDNFGLQPTPVRQKEKKSVQEEQVHYKLIDSCQSEEELMHSSNKCTTDQHRKSNDCLRYPAEVSLHKITVEDVDRVSEAKKKSCTLPVERTYYPKVSTFLPMRRESDERPPKPPKTHRSKSVDDIEKLGSEEELFIVRSQYTPGYVSADCSYNTCLGSRDALDSVEPLSAYENREELSSLDFGNRRNRFNSYDCLDESVDGLEDQDTTEEENVDQKRITKNKWKSLEDLLGHKGKKSKGKISKSRKTSVTATPLPRSTVFRTNSDNGTNVSSSVKLEFQFNDLNPAHPVLLVKLTDVVLSSKKFLSSDLLMKCYINHLSTGVCILKDKTTVSMKNYSSSVPLGILQFETDIANLSVQVLLCVGSKMFSRKVIGQVIVDLTTLDLSEGKPFSQWLPLSKPTHTG